jgi:hypothetical protein
MSKKVQGVVLGMLILTLAGGTPPAYALFGSVKKMGSAFKNGATNTASSAKNAATSTVSSVNHAATKKASEVKKADQQAKQVVGQLSDVFEKI